MAIATFRKMGKDDTFEDLTHQKGPSIEEQNLEEVEVDLLDDDEPMNPLNSRSEFGSVNEFRVDVLPSSLKGVDLLPPGWYKDSLGNDVQVADQAVAYRTPTFSGKEISGRYRTTWGYMADNRWTRLEDDVDWVQLDNPHQMLPETPIKRLITVFATRKRKDICLDSVPQSMKQKKEKKSHVFAVSSQKQKRMLDKELPYDRIPVHEKDLYQQAEVKEWESWKRFDTVEMLSEGESERIRSEKPQQVLRSRMVYRNKNAGLRDEQGCPAETKAKARLCVLGQFAPGVVEGTSQVDFPTIQRVTTYLFLNWVISWGWTKNWRIGDVSNAFLQGECPPGEPLYMEQPCRGLPGVPGGRLFKLKKSVYGLPEAPRCWYNSLVKILVDELGFEKSVLDSSLFILRDDNGQVIALLTTHVDDIMVAGDGSNKI